MNIRVPKLRPRLVPLTLRGRLLAGVVVLFTAGLLGADLAMYSMLRSSLQDGVDRHLATTASGLDRTLARPSGLTTAEKLLRAGHGGLNVIYLAPGGRVVATLPRAGVDDGQSALLGSLARPLTSGRVYQRSVAGTPYRILYRQVHGALFVTDSAVQGQAVGGIVVAAPVARERDTLNRLAASEAVVSGVALAALAGLAAVLLRLSLRPLAGMAATATAIAAGDQARRIPIDQPHTEVGQLATVLNRAFDERQQAEERLRRFLADASHELRTPLTTIRGWADLYFQGALPENGGMHTAMARIAEQAGQVSGLVEELLLLARLDEEPSLNTTGVDLVALTGEVVADARVIDPARHITLSAPRAALVTGDASRMRQVVRNLIGNALQHTPPGTSIDVAVRPDETCRAPAVRLIVADEGPGIAHADQARVFERFYRSGAVRRHAGTGLGLAIVRAIVQAHGGTVSVDSAPGAGARFEVTVPAWSPDGPADHPEA